MARARQVESGTIELQRLEEEVLEVSVVGISPVIPHKWSEKALRMMPGHPDAESVKKLKGKRNPTEEAEACLYKIGKSLAMPATAFKASIVGACRFFSKPTMVECKQLIYVEGEGTAQLVKITGEKELHEDPTRNANGSADLRYRYYILGWTAKLRIRYIPRLISSESIVALVDAAGRGGIGDWRPSAPKSCTGTFGCFRVDPTQEVRHVK